MGSNLNTKLSNSPRRLRFCPGVRAEPVIGLCLVPLTRAGEKLKEVGILPSPAGRFLSGVIGCGLGRCRISLASFYWPRPDPRTDGFRSAVAEHARRRLAPLSVLLRDQSRWGPRGDVPGARQQEASGWVHAADGKGYLNFLLCCRYCQVPFTHFFLLSILPLKAYLLGNTFIAQMFTSAHMSIYCGLPGAAQVRYDPCHHPGFNTRCFRSHSPDHSGGFLWR